MSDIDAIGSAATGGLVAAQLAGGKGRHAAHAGDKQAACPNCGTPTPGHYCPECGQHAHLHRSVAHLFHELLHNVLHLDGKFWRTLPMLLFRPGKLTRDYIEGRRARYVAPFGIFLFTIFAMYFTFAFVGAPPTPAIKVGMPIESESGNTVAIDDAAGARAQLEEARAELARMEAERAAVAADAGAAPGALAELDEEIRGQRFLVSSNERALEAARTGQYDVRGQIEDAAELISGTDTPDVNLGPGLERLSRQVEQALADPDFYIYKIKQSAYKFSFLLLPLSLPFVWLLFFWRRDLHLYDHTVFILYSLSFVSLLIIGLWLGLAFGLGWAVFWTVLSLAVPVHMYAQLKGAYRLGWFGAGVRTFFLLVFAQIVLALFLVIIAALGALD